MSSYKPNELADNSLENIVGGAGKWSVSKKGPAAKPGSGKKPTGFSPAKKAHADRDLMPGSQPEPTSGSKDS